MAALFDFLVPGPSCGATVVSCSGFGDDDDIPLKLINYGSCFSCKQALRKQGKMT